MIADLLQDILEAVLGVFVFFAIVVLHLILLVTLPIWMIPYKLWKRKGGEG
jgi:hypothetical protein